MSKPGQPTHRQNAHLTFKANRRVGRHGWLRLTPAYSYRLVRETLQSAAARPQLVLDPFSGSGTTGLVASEHGLNAHLVDVNPFLVWLATAKTRNYDYKEIEAASKALDRIIAAAQGEPRGNFWQPPLHNIERWWNDVELHALKAVRAQLDRCSLSSASLDLLLVAFCRTLISVSNAAFNHQSMSFKEQSTQHQLFVDDAATTWSVIRREAEAVFASAATDLSGMVTVSSGDARELHQCVTEPIDLIYTSPPYANRMSYIRELRPYMYWLRYLNDAREAGELDWHAIGGTWGIATSRVAEWEPCLNLPLDREFNYRLEAIRGSGALNADLLARYVHKYVEDMWQHFCSAIELLRPGGEAIYIVGNSTFYGEVVPTQEIYSNLMSEAGFSQVSVRAIRKRNSKKALYEYAVKGTKP